MHGIVEHSGIFWEIKAVELQEHTHDHVDVHRPQEIEERTVFPCFVHGSQQVRLEFRNGDLTQQLPNRIDGKNSKNDRDALASRWKEVELRPVFHEFRRRFLRVIRVEEHLELIRNKRELEILKEAIELKDILGISDVEEQRVVQESRQIDGVRKHVEITEDRNWQQRRHDGCRSDLPDASCSFRRVFLGIRQVDVRVKRELERRRFQFVLCDEFLIDESCGNRFRAEGLRRN